MKCVFLVGEPLGQQQLVAWPALRGGVPLPVRRGHRPGQLRGPHGRVQRAEQEERGGAHQMPLDLPQGVQRREE